MELSFRYSGDRYLTVDLRNEMTLGTTLRVLALDGHIRREAIAGVIETVATWRSILVHFDPLALEPHTLKDVISRLAQASSGAVAPIQSRIVEIPVRYGGRWAPDLGFVAEANDLSESEVVERHSGSLHLVGMISFTPGQANCMFLDRSKAVSAPKYKEPRTYTPEGTIGLGGTSTSLYSVPSAGGFQMIGYMPAPIYDPWQRLVQFDEPVLLKVADQLKFVPIDDDQMAEISQQVREARYKFAIKKTTLSEEQ